MLSPKSGQNNHMAAPVKVAQQQTTPEPSGTFRTLPPEPKPTRAGILRNSRTLRNLPPELTPSGTFRNLPPEPTPAQNPRNLPELASIKLALAAKPILCVVMAAKQVYAVGLNEFMPLPSFKLEHPLIARTGHHGSAQINVNSPHLSAYMSITNFSYKFPTRKLARPMKPAMWNLRV